MSGFTSGPTVAEYVELPAWDVGDEHGPERLVVTHLVLLARPWLYTLKDGSEARYTRMGGGMAVHKMGPERLRLEALCSELTGRVLPFRDGGLEHHGSRNMLETDCSMCRVAMDRRLEMGAVQVNARGTISLPERLDGRRAR